MIWKPATENRPEDTQMMAGIHDAPGLFLYESWINLSGTPRTVSHPTDQRVPNPVISTTNRMRNLNRQSACVTVLLCVTLAGVVESQVYRKKVVSYVDMVLVPPQTPLVELLEHEAGWRVLHRDPDAVLLAHP